MKKSFFLLLFENWVENHFYRWNQWLQFSSYQIQPARFGRCSDFGSQMYLYLVPHGSSFHLVSPCPTGNPTIRQFSLVSAFSGCPGAQLVYPNGFFEVIHIHFISSPRSVPADHHGPVCVPMAAFSSVLSWALFTEASWSPRSLQLRSASKYVTLVFCRM